MGTGPKEEVTLGGPDALCTDSPTAPVSRRSSYTRAPEVGSTGPGIKGVPSDPSPGLTR